MKLDIYLSRLIPTNLAYHKPKQWGNNEGNLIRYYIETVQKLSCYLTEIVIHFISVILCPLLHVANVSTRQIVQYSKAWKFFQFANMKFKLCLRYFLSSFATTKNPSEWEKLNVLFCFSYVVVFFFYRFWLYKTRMLPHGNNEGATTGATATAATFCIEKLFCSKYLPSIFIRLPPATFDKLWLCYFCCHSPSRLLTPALSTLCGVCFFSQTMAVSCHDSAATLYNKCSK